MKVNSTTIVNLTQEDLVALLERAVRNGDLDFVEPVPFGAESKTTVNFVTNGLTGALDNVVITITSKVEG